MTASRSRQRQARPPVVSIIVEEPMWRTDPNLIRTIRRAAIIAIRSAPAASAPTQPEYTASVMLTDDSRLRQLNAAFRKKARPTNVLSFPAIPALSPYVGDVALAYGVVRDQAAAQSKSLAAHAAHLVIHGILHLLGYDHERRADAKAMERLEILLVEKVGFPDPYVLPPIRQRAKRPKLRVCQRITAR